MGLFDSLFGDSTSNTAVGKKVLTAYYNEASNFSGFTFPSYDAWVAYLVARVPGFVENVGELVNGNYHSTSVSQAEDRMRSLANQSSGTATQPQLVQAAGGMGDTINWFAAVQEVGSDTISDVAEITSDLAQDLGTGTLSTLKLVKYLPWILGGAGILYITVMAKASGGKIGAAAERVSHAAASHLKKNPRKRRKKRK